MNKIVSPNSLAAARSLTEQIIKWIDEDGELDFNIAISGGSSPVILFHVWHELFLKEIDWQRLQFFWVDERCVDPRDSESNYGMTKKILFDHVPIPPNRIHRVFGEIDAGFERERYTKLVLSHVPTSHGIPVFDLVLLGIGDDGHTASIFPNKMSLLTSTQIYAVAVKPGSKQERITLTGAVITHAKHVVFFVTGESKAEILFDIFEGNKIAEGYPAYQIAKSCNDALFYLDSNAGRLLTYP